MELLVRCGMRNVSLLCSLGCGVVFGWTDESRVWCLNGPPVQRNAVAASVGAFVDAQGPAESLCIDYFSPLNGL